MRRAVAVSIVFLMAVSFLVIIPSSIADDPPNPVWVDENGNGAYDAGEYSTTSIDAVIQWMDTNGGGFTCYVGAGTYNEVIHHYGFIEGFTMIGDGMDTTIVDGDRAESTVYLDSCKYFYISGITFTNASTWAFRARNPYQSTFHQCNFSYAEYGLEMSGQVNDKWCTVTECNITHNSIRGINLGQHAMSIYHNNFISNALHAHQYRNPNWWDDGYPSGGNYWDDYDGVDEYSGFNQDIPGPDGIGDTPYLVQGTYINYDYYPLMNPWPLPFNYPPVFSNEDPENETQCVSASTDFNVYIEDPEGDLFDWSITTSPNVGSSSGTAEANGTKTATLSGLEYDIWYTVSVDATDAVSGHTTSEWYKFKTRNDPATGLCAWVWDSPGGPSPVTPRPASKLPVDPFGPAEAENGEGTDGTGATPGFEMLTLVAAVGVAFLLFKRRTH